MKSSTSKAGRPSAKAESVRSARPFVEDIVAQRWPGTSVASIDAMPGDASTRSYFRVQLQGPAAAPASLVLMAMQDASVALSSEELAVFGEGGPAELPFVNVGRFLARLTDAVPTIYGVSEDSRLLLLEDVGDTPLWEASADRPVERFGQALDLLADLQARATDDGSGCYAFAQAFDEKLFAWEFEHFLEYGVGDAPAALVEESRRELRAVAAFLAGLPRVFAHRDYHAWNIHVQDAEPGRSHHSRAGSAGEAPRLRIIDFQDALLAPALYDVASLLTDRITPERITPGIEETLLVRYYSRQKAGRLESLDATRRAYRLVALQRVLKVVGRFHYLADVKGKPHYLTFLPAVCATARRLLESSEGVAATARLFEEAGRIPGAEGSAPAPGTASPKRAPATKSAPSTKSAASPGNAPAPKSSTPAKTAAATTTAVPTKAPRKTAKNGSTASTTASRAGRRRPPAEA